MPNPLDDFIAKQSGAQTGPNGAIVSYAPPAPSASYGAPAADPDVAALSAITLPPPPGPIPPMPERPASITSTGAAIDYANALNAHEKALDDAKTYAQTAKYINDLHHEARTETEAGDFLTKLASIPASAPDYEDQVAALHASHPFAGGHAGVQDSLSIKHSARQNSIEGQKEKLAQDEHQMALLRTGSENGLLQRSDFTLENGKPNPAMVNKDGSINTHAASLVMLQRSIAGGGLKRANAEDSADRQNLTLVQKQLVDNPDDEQLKQAEAALRTKLVSRVVESTSGGKKGAAPAAKTSADYTKGF